MPGLKPEGDRKPDQPKKPRRRGFVRARMTPNHRVEHAVEQCPDCGIQLSGGWTQRAREVIELPQAPVQVTEHVYIARACAQCQRRWVPTTDIVDATRKVAGRAQVELAGTLERIRRSPVVHADETGSRGTDTTATCGPSAPPTSGTSCGEGRGKVVVDEVLGDEFTGVLVSDFYAAYHHYDGPKQSASGGLGPPAA